MMGWDMLPAGSPRRMIAKMPEDAVGLLAAFEHDEWMRERLQSGWVYGAEKDEVGRVSPYLVPFEDLSEDIKEIDRDTIRNIPILLDMIGMAIYE
jgi:hypothetical protein